MHSNDVNISKEELHNALILELQCLGLKHEVIPKRLYKRSQQLVGKTAGGTSQVFRKPLNRMSSKIVHLQSGLDAEVPTIVLDACSYVLQEAQTEGIFRKAGSTARQRDIRARLDEGGKVDFKQHHVIDVANTLKFFFRELPEPLLPYTFHDLLLHCLLLKDVESAVLLVCLLLPRPHLHVLAYVMQFFQRIAHPSVPNKMDSNNLAIIVAPSVMPVHDKVSVIQSPQRLNGHVRIVEVLISNAERIGVIPDGVTDRLSLTRSVSNSSLLSEDHHTGRTESTFSSKKKRRRSGSLTRMFNGLKKIVSGKTSPGALNDNAGTDEETSLFSSTPDFSTPCVKSSTKRKALDSTNAFSNKKKRDVLQALPQSTALADTPFKPPSKRSLEDAMNTPGPGVCPHPNPSTARKGKSKSPHKVKHHRFFTTKNSSEFDRNGFVSSSKKGLLGVGNRVISKKKQSNERHSTGGTFLERSWSAVSSSSWGRKKHRQSDNTRVSLLSTATTCSVEECDSSHEGDAGIDLSQEDQSTNISDEFVQVPMSEYNELKSRMCAIESCISNEFSNMACESVVSPDVLKAANTPQAVLTAYEKVLEDADLSKDLSTDQLAKRLSRDLKIHRSAESKVIRSPSARKIGSIRRRSRERQSPSVRRELRRNKSWHMLQRPVGMMVTNSNLKRGRPNTIFSGLPHPTPNRVLKDTKDEAVEPAFVSNQSSLVSSPGTLTRSQTRRVPSFHGNEMVVPALPSAKKFNSQVNIAKAALLAHAHQKSKLNNTSDEVWYDAEDILSKSKHLLEGAPATGRESIAKLRSENAGKVLATAKLFSANMELSKPVTNRRSNGSELETSNSSVISQEKSPAVKKTLRFARNTETPHSHGLACGADRVAEEEPKGRASRLSSHIHNDSSFSTRSNSCSQKKTSIENSPSERMQQRLRQKATSATPHSPNVVTRKVKKHNSMKVGRPVHSQRARRNLSAPVQWTNSGKENRVKSTQNSTKFTPGLSPQPIKERSPLTKQAQRVSMSPLRDSNRIDSQPQKPLTPKYAVGVTCTTPSIKQPLSRLPHRVGFTPQSARIRHGQTPLRAFVTTPLHSPSRQSPRILQQNLSNSRQYTRQQH